MHFYFRELWISSHYPGKNADHFGSSGSHPFLSQNVRGSPGSVTFCESLGISPKSEQVGGSVHLDLFSGISGSSVRNWLNGLAAVSKREFTRWCENSDAFGFFENVCFMLQKISRLKTREFAWPQDLA